MFITILVNIKPRQREMGQINSPNQSNHEHYKRQHHHAKIDDHRHETPVDGFNNNISHQRNHHTQIHILDKQ